MHLLLRFITLDKDGLEPSAGYYPPFHNLGISGQYYPFLSQCNSYHAGIVAAIEEQGIVPHYPQPLG
jgi:hypothetical protein